MNHFIILSQWKFISSRTLSAYTNFSINKYILEMSPVVTLDFFVKSTVDISQLEQPGQPP